MPIQYTAQRWVQGFGCVDSFNGNQYNPQIISHAIQRKRNSRTAEEEDDKREKALAEHALRAFYAKYI